jgi:hypothetical protein
VNGVTLYTRGPMKCNVQWSVEYIVLWGEWCQRCVSLHRWEFHWSIRPLVDPKSGTISANPFYKIIFDRRGIEWHTILFRRRLGFKRGTSRSLTCMKFAQRDTIIHRLTTCRTSAEIWSGTRLRLAMMMRTHPRYIPYQGLLFPNLVLWPRQKHNAVLWHGTLYH